MQIGLTPREQEGYTSLPTDALVMGELEIYGSNGLQPSRYHEIFDMVNTGKLDPGKVISERIGLGELNDELAAMTDFETIGIPVVTEFDG